MDVVNQSPGLPRLADYLAFVRRHRVLLVSLVSLGLLFGIVWSMRQPSTYSSTVSIALSPVPKYVTTPGETLPPEVTIDTDAQLLSSPDVVEAVADRLGIDPSEVEKRVSVSASANSHVLHVTVTSRSRQRSADAANAAAEALLDVRRQTLGALNDSQLNQVRILLTHKEDQLIRTQSRRLVVPATDELFADVMRLRASLDELEAARAEPGDIIRSAKAPARHDYANTEVPLTSGPMVGLLLGCLIGATRDSGLVRAPTAHIAKNFAHPVRRTAG
jgi:capsular polysaccharide biosynthesis protein